MNVPIKSVAIIGFGWLGKALTADYIGQKIATIATTRDKEKLKDIQALGAMSSLLSLPVEPNDKQVSVIFSYHHLIICIPPYFKKGQKDYPDKIAQIVALAEQGGVESIILISSTAAYQGHVGDVDEYTVPHRELEKVDLICAAEQAVLNFSRRGIVLRCAGLVGPNRHPGRFFSKGREISDPHAYVNLVHQDDVVSLCHLLMQNPKARGIYNCVSQTQVTKQHFYTVAAHCLGKETPPFNKKDAANLGRHVVAKRTMNELDYKLQHPDMLTWLVKHQKQTLS